jgi:putative transposase
MPRKPRFFLPNVPVHMIIRGNNRQSVFAETEDYLSYRHWMKEAANSCNCQIYAYVLMTNHIHILLSANKPSNISKFSQSIGRKYVPYFNHKYGKSGTLWEGRFKATSIDSEDYLLACYRYIEMNPVRAGMVSDSKDYLWSSHLANAYGEQDELLTPHFLYLRLGDTKKLRQMCYRDLFREEIPSTLLSEIRHSTQTGTPLGKKKFKDEIEALLQVKIGYSRQGRPKKTKKEN